MSSIASMPIITMVHVQFILKRYLAKKQGKLDKNRQHGKLEQKTNDLSATFADPGV